MPSSDYSLNIWNSSKMATTRLFYFLGQKKKKKNDSRSRIDADTHTHTRPIDDGRWWWRRLFGAVPGNIWATDTTGLLRWCVWKSISLPKSSFPLSLSLLCLFIEDKIFFFFRWFETTPFFYCAKSPLFFFFFGRHLRPATRKSIPNFFSQSFTSRVKMTSLNTKGEEKKKSDSFHTTNLFSTSPWKSKEKTSNVL